MGLFDFFKARPKGTANLARERLTILVAQERSSRGAPDYLPLLKKELLEVIRKYVNVQSDAVSVKMQKDGNQDIFELSVTLPDKA
jgi:cell division topological specificity factor